MPDEPFRGGCMEAVTDLHLDADDHCPSCHSVWDDEYDEMLEIYTDEGWYTVCCSVAIAHEGRVK